MKNNGMRSVIVLECHEPSEQRSVRSRGDISAVSGVPASGSGVLIWLLPPSHLTEILRRFPHSTRAHAREHIQLRLSITERWRNTRAGAHTDIGPMDTRHDTRKKSNSTEKDMTTHRCEDGAARLHQFLPLAGPRCPDHPSPLPTCVLSLACCYDENTHKNVGFTRCFLITAGTSLSGQRLPALLQDRRN